MDFGWLGLPRRPTLAELPSCLSHSKGGLCQYLITSIISLPPQFIFSPLHHSQTKQIHPLPSIATNNTIAMTSEAQSKMLTLESSDGETIPVGEIYSVSMNYNTAYIKQSAPSPSDQS